MMRVRYHGEESWLKSVAEGEDPEPSPIKLSTNGRRTVDDLKAMINESRLRRKPKIVKIV